MSGCIKCYHWWNPLVKTNKLKRLLQLTDNQTSSKRKKKDPAKFKGRLTVVELSVYQNMKYEKLQPTALTGQLSLGWCLCLMTDIFTPANRRESKANIRIIWKRNRIDLIEIIVLIVVHFSALHTKSKVVKVQDVDAKTGTLPAGWPVVIISKREISLAIPARLAKHAISPYQRV